MTPQTAAAPPGLVPSAITGRPGEESDQREQWANLVDSAWRPEFPDASLVGVAAAMLPAVELPVGQLEEGPHWRISLGPGVVAVGTKDYAKANRAEERELRRRQVDSEMNVAWLMQDEELPEPVPSRSITEWSRKSRARMVRRLCELDYLPLYVDQDGRRHGRLPAMVTLTFPGDWLTVCPTGKHLKALLKTFRKRYQRAWGEPLTCVWKLEFQRRGAPHVHMLMTPPHGRDAQFGKPFREWLSWTWADIVDHPDPDERARHLAAGTGVDFAEGLRAKDPRRVAVYFLKHNVAGDKEYQHDVPEEWHEPGNGPGRFWGYWTLKPATATVEVTAEDAIAAARVMRRWSKAQGRIMPRSRPRTDGGRVTSKYPEVQGLAGAQLVAAHAGPVRRRRSRSRVVLMSRSRGWVAVPDGPAFAAELGRYLDQRAAGHTAREERQRAGERIITSGAGTRSRGDA